MYVLLVNQAGKSSWPITGATFVLVQKDQTDASRAKAMLNFWNWCYTSGQSDATALDYVPVPQPGVLQAHREERVEHDHGERFHPDAKEWVKAGSVKVPGVGAVDSSPKPWLKYTIQNYFEEELSSLTALVFCLRLDLFGRAGKSIDALA